jgi:hypothetical protein
MFAYVDPDRLCFRRKVRLMACTCVRRAWHLLTREKVRAAVEAAELRADGLLKKEELRPGWMAVRKALSMSPLGSRWEHALMAALHATTPEQHDCSVQCAATEVTRALSDDPREWRIYGAHGMSGWKHVCPRERTFLCDLLSDLFGYLFHPLTLSSAWLTWNNAIVVRLAEAAYNSRILPAGTLDNAYLAVLADALEEADCGDELILRHLRGGGEHYRGCFVVDALLGKS